MDALGRPVTTTSPAETGRPATTTSFGYNRAGQWKSSDTALRTTPPSTTIVSDVLYNARGQRTHIVLGDGGRPLSSTPPTPVPPPDHPAHSLQRQARSRGTLALLSKRNQMTRFQQLQIRPGATYFRGATAPQGVFYPGGKTQLDVPNVGDRL